MLDSMRQKFQYGLFKIALAVKKNPLLKRALNTAGIGSIYRKFNENNASNSREIFFDADIYGTKIKILDGSRQQEYFHEYYTCGSMYEAAFTAVLTDVLNRTESTTFIDIGAHIGYFTVYAANLLGDSGKIVSVEPNPEYYDYILKNIQLNNLGDKVRTFQLALSSKPGKASSGGYEGRDSIESDTGDIDIITFDQLCETEGFEPDIVKIDVHGAEYKVLAGMPEMLENKIKHLFVEIHPIELMQGYNIHDVIKLLDDRKYELMELTDFASADGGNLHPIDDDFMNSDEHRMLYARRR